MVAFILITIKPFDHAAAKKERFIPIPIVEEIPLEEEQQEAEEKQIAQQISHHVRNNNALMREAEQYFSQDDPLDEALNSSDEVEPQPEIMEASSGVDYRQKIAELRKKRQEIRSSGDEANTQKVSRKSTTSRYSTVSYNLVDRDAVRIPNPVYTCDATGKVVINIEVNGGGGVIKTTYNKSASTTSNGCLVDQATEYAKKAYFNKSSREKQLGSITFEFQG